MTLDPIEQKLVDWANSRPDVHALVLTSTRAVPGAALDCLSDYDVIVAVDDITPYFESRAWLEAFGHVLVLYRDPILQRYPDSLLDDPVDRRFGYVTQFEDQGLKIDFSIMTAGLMRRIAGSPLDEEWDAGYRILLDKDGLLEGIAPPTHHGYIPKPPTLAEYLEEIELFFHELTYMAKYLWRGDLIPARSMHEEAVIGWHVSRQIAWQIEIAHGWELRLKAHGRQLQKLAPPDTWAGLTALYGPPDTAAMWDVLYRTIGLYARLARANGAALGFDYPQDLHDRCLAYFHWIQSLPVEKCLLG